jgi:hypothetical protein
MADRERTSVAIRRDLRHAARLDLPTLLDLVHAIIELAIARIRLSTRKARELLTSKGQVDFQPSHSSGEDPELLIDRVAFAIPRMGSRVPWRADCLVQALAARRWLGGHGVATSLVVGVRKPPPAGFAAHAWLMAGDRVVTGGEVDAYRVILKQQTGPNPKDGAGWRQ